MKKNPMIFPYPTEHSARLVSPTGFIRFRRQNDKFGSGIHAIWGVRSDQTVVLQAIRFDKTKFTVTQAKAWLKDHDYKPIRFEPAIKQAAEKSLNNVKIFGLSFDVEGLKFDEGGKITEIQVFNIGTWEHSIYGKIKIVAKSIIQFIKNFETKVRKDIPITEGHSVGEEKPAIGWFKQLINKGRDGLWAKVEWNEEGVKLLKSKAYKYFSPEFYDTYEDPETHEKYRNVLVGGALTNNPYFKGLAAVTLSEFTFVDKDMNLEEILKKDIGELTDEEKTFLKEHKDELTDGQKETYKDIIVEEGSDKGDDEGDDEGGDKSGDEGNDEDSLKDILEKKPEDLTDEEKETLKEKKDDLTEEQKDTYKDILEEKKEETEGSEVKIDKLTLSTLQRNATEGVKAMARLRKNDAEIFVTSKTFTETNPKGPLLPKSQDKVVAFLLSLTEGQQAKFKEILGELPKAELFSELGKEAGIAIKASEQVQQMAEKLMEKNDKLSLRQAYDRIFADNPALAKQVEQEK